MTIAWVLDHLISQFSFTESITLPYTLYVQDMGTPDLISAPVMAREAGIESIISTVSTHAAPPLFSHIPFHLPYLPSYPCINASTNCSTIKVFSHDWSLMPLSQLVPLKYLLPSSRIQACHLLLPYTSPSSSVNSSILSCVICRPNPFIWLPLCHSSCILLLLPSVHPCHLLYRRTQRTLDRHTGICYQSVSHVLMDRNQSSQVRTLLPSPLLTAPLSTVPWPLMASHLCEQSLHCPSISSPHHPLVTLILTQFPVHSTLSSSPCAAGAVFGSVPHIVQVDDYVDTLAFKVQCPSQHHVHSILYFHMERADTWLTQTLHWKPASLSSFEYLITYATTSLFADRTIIVPLLVLHHHSLLYISLCPPLNLKHSKPLTFLHLKHIFTSAPLHLVLLQPESNYILTFRNEDRPGVISEVLQVLNNANVNVASLNVTRAGAGQVGDTFSNLQFEHAITCRLFSMWYSYDTCHHTYWSPPRIWSLVLLILPPPVTSYNDLFSHLFPLLSLVLLRVKYPVAHIPIISIGE